MRTRRFAAGVVVSILWIVVCLSLLFVKRADLTSMAPNAWGDFFAGAFAPLAFLWLVLGYLQQGEELNLSTQALQLQAEELRNSVEQQRALVEVSRQQVESERDALAYERQRQDEAAKPKLVIVPGGGSFRGDGESNYRFLITNAGSIASTVLGRLQLGDGTELRVVEVPILDRGQQQTASFTLPQALSGTAVLQVTYRDALGRESGTAFSVCRATAHPHSELAFSRIEA